MANYGGGQGHRTFTNGFVHSTFCTTHYLDKAQYLQYMYLLRVAHSPWTSVPRTKITG